MKRLILCVCVLTAIPLARARSQAASPGLNAPRPIDAFDSVFLEQLTWLAGKTTAIIPTGAIEPNGPYLALGKHNYVLQATTERIARELGTALVAPIVPFVPGGDIDPPSGHMRYPGTISLQQSTFRPHGFTRIILIGDSGGNQDGMRDVAEALSAEWKGSGNTIHFIPEYYDNPRWKRWLEGHGIHEVDEGLHDDVRHSAIMMVVDPSTVRMEQRLEAGLFSINGIPLAPAERTIELGNSLIDYQADVTVEAIRRVTGGQ